MCEIEAGTRAPSLRTYGPGSSFAGLSHRRCTFAVIMGEAVEMHLPTEPLCADLGRGWRHDRLTAARDDWREVATTHGRSALVHALAVMMVITGGPTMATVKDAQLPGPSFAGVHTEHEDHPWTIDIPDHPQRKDSAEYVASRTLMNEIAKSVSDFYYGAQPYQDHHGGGLWLKDNDGWFLVRNVAGMEWSAQFCADPKRVDQLRLNARRLYAAFPDAVKVLGIRELLDTPITDAAGVARWTDSICNASVPLPPALHTGVLPQGGGVHHYPAPITEIALFKYADFQLWVTDAQDQPVAVAPVSSRGSGDGRVRVLYATPNTDLDHALRQAHAADKQHILPEDHPVAQQAFARQAVPTKATPEAAAS